MAVLPPLLYMYLIYTYRYILDPCALYCKLYIWLEGTHYRGVVAFDHLHWLRTVTSGRVREFLE